jgi:hypothetical protein
MMVILLLVAVPLSTQPTQPGKSGERSHTACQGMSQQPVANARHLHPFAGRSGGLG